MTKTEARLVSLLSAVRVRSLKMGIASLTILCLALSLVALVLTCGTASAQSQSLTSRGMLSVIQCRRRKSRRLLSITRVAGCNQQGPRR